MLKYVYRLTRKMFKNIRLVHLSALLLSFTTLQLGAKIPVPENFKNYMVFMATGSIPLGVPHPEIPGCGNGLFCDGQYFHTEIMGRSQFDIDQEFAKAKQYWAERFGIDADAPEYDNRIQVFSMYIDPRGDYRAYTIANQKVPSKGFEIRDGGFALMITDPEGVTMGGEFAGQVLSEGSMLVYGNYNIAVTDKKGKIKDTIVIWYRSNSPMITNDWGELSINCQISMDNWQGQKVGSASGLAQPLLVSSENTLDLSWRNVLTFN